MITVNSACYVHVLNMVVFTTPMEKMNKHGTSLFSTGWYNIAYSQYIYGSCKASVPWTLPHLYFGDILWSPRSPNLSACDFFQWWYLQQRVYNDNPELQWS